MGAHGSRHARAEAAPCAPLPPLAWRPRAQVWDLATLDLIRSLEGHTDAVRALAVSGGRLFSGSYDGTVHVWDEGSLMCLKVGPRAAGWDRACCTRPARAASSACCALLTLHPAPLFARCSLRLFVRAAP